MLCIINELDGHYQLQ